MRIQNKDFNVGTEKKITVITEKNLEIETAIQTISDVETRKLLTGADRLVKLCNAWEKQNRKANTGKTQILLNKLDWISQQDENLYSEYQKRLAMNIQTLGKNSYSFKYLEVKQLRFICNEKNLVHVLYSEFKTVPNGYNSETGDIVFTSTEGKNPEIEIQTLNVEGLNYIEVTEKSLKKAVLNDKDGVKLGKLKELFNESANLLDKNNIRVIEKDSIALSEEKTKDLIERLKSEVRALDILSRNREIRASQQN